MVAKLSLYLSVANPGKIQYLFFLFEWKFGGCYCDGLEERSTKNGDKRNPILIAYNTQIFNTIVFIIENVCSRRHEHLINQ